MKLTDEQFTSLVNRHPSFASIAREINVHPSGVRRRAAKLGLYTPAKTGEPRSETQLSQTQQWWREKYPLEELLVENSTRSRTVLRTRILNDELLEYICQICGQEPIWCGKPMPLILDHINGVNNDHRLENLRFVCGHCDSQLDTYKSRNRRNTGK